MSEAAILKCMQLNIPSYIAGSFVEDHRQQEYSPTSQNNDGAELSPHSRAATPLECFTYTTEVDHDNNYQTLVRADARFMPNLTLDEVRNRKEKSIIYGTYKNTQSIVGEGCI